MPNPIKCSEDITQFNSFIQRQKLYQFLAGINENLDKESRDLLNQDPLPTIKMAYAMIRRELARRGIMGTTSSLGTSPSEIGKGLAIKSRSETSFWHDNGDRTHLKCTHCGGTKHTKEGCFKLIWYPECGKNISTGEPPPRPRFPVPAARLTLLLSFSTTSKHLKSPPSISII